MNHILLEMNLTFVYSRDKIVKKTSISALNEIMTKLVVECGLREVETIIIQSID